MTTIHLPPASAVLAVGVDLMTDPVSQRGHGSIKALRSDLGTRHLEVATKPDLSGRTYSRRQSNRTACLGKIATNSQICASSAWTNSPPREGRSCGVAMWLLAYVMYYYVMPRTGDRTHVTAR